MIDRTWLEDRAFLGFVSFAELRESGLVQAPRHRGVYAVLRERSDTPEFLPSSSGGRFKGKDPSVPIAKLQAAWVAGSQVLYFGKAGRLGTGPFIRQRLAQYLAFGEGRPVGHWGGRYIWQIAGSLELRVAWLAARQTEPRVLESQLIAEFECATGKLPFANLKR